MYNYGDDDVSELDSWHEQWCGPSDQYPDWIGDCCSLPTNDSDDEDEF